MPKKRIVIKWKAENMKLKKLKQSELFLIQKVPRTGVIKVRGVPSDRLLNVWLKIRNSYDVNFCKIRRRRKNS